MSQSNETTSAPVLRQVVKFGERYVSSALNRKFAGIIETGVYHGFLVKPGGVGRVLITKDSDYPRSVAVVERGGYSLHISMDDDGYVDIPAAGEWYIVIEAFYIETQPGYQRIVARDKVEDHHIILARVIVDDISVPTAADMIDTESRTLPNTKELQLATKLYHREVVAAAQFITLTDRVTRLELAQISGLLDVSQAVVSGDACDCGELTEEIADFREELTEMDLVEEFEEALNEPNNEDDTPGEGSGNVSAS